MERKSKIMITKMRTIRAVFIITLLIAISGCGEKQEAESHAEPAFPSNEMEIRVEKTEFDSYDEIISLLEPGEAYTYVNIKGYDGDVLLITDYTYDNMNGNMVTVQATPYTLKSSGKVTADSLFVSGGTANPIALDKEGMIYIGTHDSIGKQCYGTNGTDNVAIMIMETVTISEYDDNGLPKSVFGFIRTENTVIDNDGEEIASDDTDKFDEMFEEYENNATPIGFIVVEK